MKQFYETYKENENESNILDTEKIKEKFWDMFIVDSLIGNTDRHNGNWGVLLNNATINI